MWFWWRLTHAVLTEGGAWRGRGGGFNPLSERRPGGTQTVQAAPTLNRQANAWQANARPMKERPTPSWSVPIRLSLPGPYRSVHCSGHARMRAQAGLSLPASAGNTAAALGELGRDGV